MYVHDVHNIQRYRLLTDKQRAHVVIKTTHHMHVVGVTEIKVIKNSDFQTSESATRL